MNAPRIRLILISIIAVLCLFFAFERNFLAGINEKPAYKGFYLLESVVRLIKTDYIEEKDPAQTMEGAFKGLIDSLDPISSYFNREATIKFRQKNSRWGDIGVILFKSSFGLFPQVVGIVENSPAERAGLKVGDYISALDGTGTMSMSFIEAGLYLKDLEQKPVTIKVVRENETLELKAEREVLSPDPCLLSSAGRFAVLKIHNLYPPCVDKIRKNILPLLKSQKKPLVLDLRNCYEGDIEEARILLNLFIKSSKAGSFEKKGGVKDVFAFTANPDLGTPPAAVWVNPGTMGPAELVAGVLQETRKTKVIGGATPGLVSKQDLFPLPDGSSVLLTSGVFALKSGKKLWGEGVTPDEKLGPGDQTSSAYIKRTEALYRGR